MALGSPHSRPATARWERWALVVGNALPVLAYAAGALPFLEAFLAFLLEPPIVGLAMAAKLALVEPPAGEESSALLTVDSDWLASPLRVTAWGLRRAAAHLAVFVGIFVLFYGLTVGMLLTVVASDVPTIAGVDALSAASLALLALGFVVGRAFDLAQFVAGYDGRRSDTERVRRRSRLELHRLYLLNLVFALVGVTALTVAAAAPTLALGGFVGVKTLLDLRYRAVANGPL